MIDAIRSEWIKLRSARSNVVLIVMAIVAPLVFSTLFAIFAHFQNSDSREIFSNVVLGPNYLCVFFAGVIGVLGIGQEYRHNTIRATFTAEPKRSRVLTAKVVVTVLFGLGIGLMSVLLDFGVSKTILSARDISFSLTQPGENLTAVIGQVVLCGLFTLAGFGIGAIIRQPAGAIPVILLWPLIVEPLIGGLLSLITDSARKWLPFSEGLRLPLTGGDGIDRLSRLPAGLYFGAVVAAIVALGWLLVERRDA